MSWRTLIRPRLARPSLHAIPNSGTRHCDELPCAPAAAGRRLTDRQHYNAFVHQHLHESITNIGYCFIGCSAVQRLLDTRSPDCGWQIKTIDSTGRHEMPKRLAGSARQALGRLYLCGTDSRSPREVHPNRRRSSATGAGTGKRSRRKSKEKRKGITRSAHTARPAFRCRPLVSG